MRTLKKKLKALLEPTGLLVWYYNFYPQRPLFISGFWAYLRLSRWVIYGRLRLRMLYFMLRHKFRVQELVITAVPDSLNSQAHLQKVINRNFYVSFATSFARRRSEHLIYLLRSICSVTPQSRVLSIGPRNEGELLLFKAHGFRHVEAIDLFTYSPWIRLMDMHHMDYADNSFDVICCGWVVRYCYDLKKAAQEMVRVCKSGAHVAIGFSMDPEETDTHPAIGTHLHGGVDELLGYFAPNVDYVYWRMEDRNRDESQVPECTNSVVFRLKK